TTVAAVTVDIESVVRVNFNSTTIDVSETQTRSSLEDLSTDTDGPVKLVSLAGSITVNGGSGGPGVSANGSGDVLLEAAQDVIINADVISGTGNITLDAANDLTVNAAVSTGGSGTLYMVAGNVIAINDSVTTVSDDVLLEAGSTLTQAAAITSTSGDVGLLAVGLLHQTSDGDINTGGDVLVSAGTDWTMVTGTEITATGNVVGEALAGDIGLGVISGANVALTASNSILDSNAGSMNITATNLSLVATGGLIGGDDSGNGSPSANLNAIDITVSTLAANADSGIYVLEADGLTITTVAEVTVDIESVVRVNFNSTTTDVSETQTRSSLEGLSTDTDGPVKLVSLAGSITINGGSGGPGVSANGSGDVLLEAAQDVFINADVISGNGTLTKDFYEDPDLLAVQQQTEQVLTNENRTANIDVRVAAETLVGVVIDWQELDAERDYMLFNQAINGFFLASLERTYQNAPITSDSKVVIDVSINAFAPETPDGKGTIRIFENGEDVLTQDRFQTTVSIKVVGNMTGEVVMMPSTPELDLRTVPAPMMTAPPIIIQQNDSIITREYGQSTSSTPRIEKPFFFLKFEGLIPQKSDGDLSLDYQLKSLSATEENSDADFDVDQLPILFGRLPDNYYELFLKDGASEQLIMRFIIQDGNPINVPPEFSRIGLSNEFDNQERSKKDSTGVDQEVDVSGKPHRKRDKEVNDKVELSSPDTAIFPPETESTDEPATADGTAGPEELRPLSFIEELGRTPVIALAGTLLTGTRYRYEQKQKITDCSEVTK
ncbi:MAG: hypothetical protein ACR2NF_06625, partial [Pirellulales bacterium]